MQEKILIYDFGSQYTQLIARRIRELNVFCEIFPFQRISKPDTGVKGIILSGSPFSVLDKNAPHPDLSGITGHIPLLGICYGAQYLVHNHGGEVLPSSSREYGRANLKFIKTETPLFDHIPEHAQVWMSHGDTISRLPEGFDVLAGTEDIHVGAFRIRKQDVYGLQFHPEVYHTPNGKDILRNFLVNICGCRQSWTAGSIIEQKIGELRSLLGKDKIILGLSGGVDSSVTALLLHKAVGSQLTGIFVNNGLLRKNEYRIVLDSYKEMGLNIHGVDASAQFLDDLSGVSDPERKRKIIGRNFVEIFEAEAVRIKNIRWLAQGTIYPDVIESVSVNGPSAKIKSHHNVGGLPEKMNLRVVEPLKLLFKDEVRNIGKVLGLKDVILNRHPFPGPGLAVRIVGEITRENIAILQKVDDVFIRGLKEYDLYDHVWQAAAILLPIHSVGVMGDERTYERVVALRAVESTDGMTADWSQLPYEFLGKISNEIINKIKGVNRVVYDISSKPPATIEWE